MYKTIVLALLQERSELHEELRRNRTLLPTLNRLASHLKTNHESWKDRLLHAKPGTCESQLASEALEIALQDLVDSLLLGFQTEGSDPLTLDGAMAFIRGQKPPA